MKHRPRHRDRFNAVAARVSASNGRRAWDVEDGNPAVRSRLQNSELLRLKQAALSSAFVLALETRRRQWVEEMPASNCLVASPYAAGKVETSWHGPQDLQIAHRAPSAASRKLMRPGLGKANNTETSRSACSRDCRSAARQASRLSLPEDFPAGWSGGSLVGRAFPS